MFASVIFTLTSGDHALDWPIRLCVRCRYESASATCIRLTISTPARSAMVRATLDSASAAAAGKSQSIHGVFKQPGSVRRKLDRITVDFRVVGRSLRPVSAAHR